MQPWVSTFRDREPLEPRTTFGARRYPRGVVVQSEGDVFDPLAGAKETAQHLGHSLVTVKDSAAHEIFRLGQNIQVDEIVNTYLLDDADSDEDVTVVDSSVTVAG